MLWVATPAFVTGEMTVRHCGGLRGVRRTVEVRLPQSSVASALKDLRRGAESAGMTIRGESDSRFAGSVRAADGRGAAEVRIDVRRERSGDRLPRLQTLLRPGRDDGVDGPTIAKITIGMSESKHLGLVNELTKQMTSKIDDHGLDVVSKRHRLFKFISTPERRALRYYFRGDERVLSLGTGLTGGRLGIVCLTSARLVFVGKEFLIEPVDAKNMAVSSIRSVKAMSPFGGGRLSVATARRTWEITNLRRGHAEEIDQLISELRSQRS